MKSLFTTSSIIVLVSKDTFHYSQFHCLAAKLQYDVLQRLRRRSAKTSGKLFGKKSIKRHKMDERIEIWNVLHDGEITAISQVSDTLTMFVSIPYLRRRLKPLGDSFVLTLAGVRQVECRDFNGTASSATSLQEKLDIGIPTIFQTGSESMPITIETALGQLILDFQSIQFALDTGQPVEYGTIKEVCIEYWADWRARTEKARLARPG